MITNFLGQFGGIDETVIIEVKYEGNLFFVRVYVWILIACTMNYVIECCYSHVFYFMKTIVAIIVNSLNQFHSHLLKIYVN